MSVAQHNNLPTQTAEGSIAEVAATHGISLDENRQAQLAATAAYIKRASGYPEAHKPAIVFWDTNGVEVRRTAFSERFGTTAAQLDFTPTLEEDGDFVSGDATPRPDRATAYALMGLRGMQNYALLVEAGIIEKPEVLYGNTNPQMAIVAERLGLLSDVARGNSGHQGKAHTEIRKANAKLEVHGTYDEVHDHLFSPETQRLERVLSRRLAAEQAGAAALSA
ncbi:MAG TPA: hypothetical protein VLF59_03315 [Candidatus Saccharimonadales bacterium]|nr:hypothetical protein [Candidatus Saccharimonadales bacterium]